MHNYLEFEKSVADLEGQVRELRSLGNDDGSVDVSDEITRLESKASLALQDIYKKLNPWQKTQVARHPDRPHFSDYVDALIDDYIPLCGDRKFAEDHALLTGIGRFEGRSIMVIGNEKGNNTESRIKHNFGMARPEGYRKVVRMLELAQRFDIPVLSLVDTAGAYPGIGAEERGQAEAIARSTEACLNIGVPTICVIIGEAGSGGAIAIAAANRVLMLEHSIYSVISPEGAASILWRDSTRAKDAATAMKITSDDILQMGVIDKIITEPIGGAHRNPEAVYEATRKEISLAFAELAGKSSEEIRHERQEKFLAIGRNL